MIKEPFNWDRIRRFYKRNDTAFWCVGAVVFFHFFWWQVQQNKAFIGVHERRRHLGPLSIPYLDELDIFKKKPTETTDSSSSK